MNANFTLCTTIKEILIFLTTESKKLSCLCKQELDIFEKEEIFLFNTARDAISLILDEYITILKVQDDTDVAGALVADTIIELIVDFTNVVSTYKAKQKIQKFDYTLDNCLPELEKFIRDLYLLLSQDKYIKKLDFETIKGKFLSFEEKLKNPRYYFKLHFNFLLLSKLFSIDSSISIGMQAKHDCISNMCFNYAT